MRTKHYTILYGILLLINSYACNYSISIDAPEEGASISEFDTIRFTAPIRSMGTIPEMAPPVISRLNPAATTINAHPNINRQQAARVSPIRQAKTSIIGENGYPIPEAMPIQGKIQPYIFPAISKANPPSMQENAVADLRCLKVDQGMLSALVICIVEDAEGFLWVGTDGGGISRYDGHHFLHITEQEGLVNNRVNAMVFDSMGHLWIATFHGLSYFDGQQFVNYTQAEGLPSSTINDMIIDRKGNLWLATRDGLSYLDLSKKDPGKGLDFVLTHYTQREGLPDQSIAKVIEDLEGNIWFATRENGVLRFSINPESRGGELLQISTEQGLSGPKVRSLLADQKGNIWIGTFNNGINIYHPDADELIQYSSDNGLSHRAVISLMEDSQQNIWIGTGSGLNLYQPLGENKATFTFYSTDQGLSHTNIYGLFEDSHENIWIGTYNGLCIFDPLQDDSGGGSAFNFLSKRNGLLSDKVISILEDQEKNLWFGTMGGVHKYDGQTMRQYTEPDGLSSKSVRAMLEDSRGQLWLGTERGGLNRYFPEAGHTGKVLQYGTPQGLTDIHITAMLEDSRGELWFGTLMDGVNRFIPDEEGEGGQFIQYRTEDGLTDDEIRFILEDQSGNIWFGSRGGGATCYTPDADGKGGAFKSFTVAEGLCHDEVNTMLEDSRGYLWFGTWGGGVTRYHPPSGVTTHYTTEDGLSSNIIWTIMEDEENRIWMATEHGLSLLVPKESKANEPFLAAREAFDFYTFGKRDGLKRIVFEGNSFTLDHNNQAWWGGGFNEGLTMMDLNHFKLPEALPKVYMTQLTINQQKINFRQVPEVSQKLPAQLTSGLSPVVPFFNYPRDLKLPFSANHLTFDFTAIDWQAPGKIRFSYQMEGLENNWSPPSTNTQADYRSLPAGDYVFKVRAIGATQAWSPSFDYAFSIRPPWWRSWWAVFIYFNLLGLLIYFFILWRLAALRKERNEKQAFAEALINAQEEEKKRIARDLHDSVGQSLVLLKKEIDKIQNTSLTNRKLIAETLQEVRSISRDLHPFQLEKFGLTIAIKEILKKTEQSTTIFISHDIQNIDNLLSPKAEINLYRTIQESISNIIKHANATGVKLSIRKAEKNIYVKVQDNGQGFNFAEAKDRRQSLGLKTMFERINSIGGQLDFEAGQPQGTVIRIKVPY